MSKLPVVRFREMERVLVKLGFEAVRQKGSHVFYRHPDGRTTTVPNHPGRDLASSEKSSVKSKLRLNNFCRSLNVRESMTIPVLHLRRVGGLR